MMHKQPMVGKSLRTAALVDYRCFCLSTSCDKSVFLLSSVSKEPLLCLTVFLKGSLVLMMMKLINFIDQHFRSKERKFAYSKIINLPFVEAIFGIIEKFRFSYFILDNRLSKAEKLLKIVHTKDGKFIEINFIIL